MDAILQAGAGSLDAAYALIAYGLLAAARTLGASLLFTAFSWGRISSGIIRSVFALVLALPMLVRVSDDPTAAIAAIGAGYVPLLLKELALGLAIGFLASLPLEALGIAGAAVDATNGGGQLSGAGGESTVQGHLFMVVGLWVFAALGGFFHFAQMIYESHALWPLDRPLPDLDRVSLAGLGALLWQFTLLVLTVGGPLVLLLLLTDLSLLVATRLGKQMNVLDLSLSIKNLLLILVLPLYAAVIVRVATGAFPSIFDLRLLEAALGP